MANRTLSDLPVVVTPAAADIIHTRQGLTDKSITNDLLSAYAMTVSDNSPIVVAVTGTTHTVDTNIRKQLIIATISSNSTFTFPGSYGDAYEIIVKNDSSSTANVLGLPNSEVLYPGQEISFIWDGSAWLKRLFINRVIQLAGIPTAAPNFIGQIYIDTTNGWRYIATGVSAVSDWHVQYAYGTSTVTAAGGDITVNLGGNWINGELTIYRSQSTSDYIAGWTGVKLDTTYDAITNAAYTLNQIVMHRSTTTGNFHENLEKTNSSSGVPNAATATSFTLDDDGVQTAYVKWIVKA